MKSWVKWVLGIVAAGAVLGASGAATKVISHGEAIATLETHYEHIKGSLKRIEDKVDKLAEKE